MDFTSLLYQAYSDACIKTKIIKTQIVCIEPIIPLSNEQQNQLLEGDGQKNKNEYKKYIELLLGDSNKRKKMGKQARISSEVYSSKYFAERVSAVYKQAIDNRKRSLLEKIKGVFNGEK